MSQQTYGSPSHASAQVSSVDYQNFRKFLEKACGILLGENKQYLVASRLSKIMASHKIACLSELIEKMSMANHRALKEAVIDAMTTNETLWFRDTHPFEVFKNTILPACIARGESNIRIWSAACSSGQEPYSLSMVYDEYLLANRSLKLPPLSIVATDLSKTMIEACRAAEYDGLSLGRGLSNQRLRQFFEPTESERWRVKPQARDRVRFQLLNLMDSFVSLGKFDAVFCRNVLIYFSLDLKKDILRRIHATLKPGGYLVLGASEGLADLSELYEMVHCHPGIIYKAL
ncbi:protein-glutamate O-methyltransferase CheR [Dasania sp. GY-MA-18]|uniref:protein-glutamate O-methyltransferase n=1 Tax=Dasania phycosphaerae TaxID=2950436 RepID=A0A9J6RGQ2_9GAMM|nr:MULTISPECIES: protein-glutamate O-methyltransferase CheR [Dasania]MCR8921402.1 protein-glutamate O-methyltransferase CheR [Dasania sp. GY-MA-18]MCZ0863830.1 protein-glutamate O-methyltransferase CheR [Dasania phycosphaerae]MCZ0867558.1 protein-glutamate O-methyltransferase CheR [Dasania phycosphaerae]